MLVGICLLAREPFEDCPDLPQEAHTRPPASYPRQDGQPRKSRGWMQETVDPKLPRIAFLAIPPDEPSPSEECCAHLPAEDQTQSHIPCPWHLLDGRRSESGVRGESGRA